MRVFFMTFSVRKINQNKQPLVTIIPGLVMAVYVDWLGVKDRAEELRANL